MELFLADTRKHLVTFLKRAAHLFGVVVREGGEVGLLTRADLSVHNESDDTVIVANGGDALKQTRVAGVYILARRGATPMKRLAVAFQASRVHQRIAPQKLAEAAKPRRVIAKLVAVEIVHTGFDPRQIVEIP